MTRILTTIHLSDIQKEVLAKSLASPNPQIAWETVAKTEEDVDNNFVAAKNVLGNLGLLTIGDGTLEVSEKGLTVMQDENLTDEMGELTDEGRELADIDRSEVPKPEGQSQPKQPPEDELEGLPMESLTLVRTLNEQAEAIQDVKTLSVKKSR